MMGGFRLDTPSANSLGGGSSPLMLVTATVDLQNAETQTVTGFPALYAVVGEWAHSPSVDLSTVSPGLAGITMLLGDVGSFTGDNQLADIDGITVKGKAGAISIYNVRSGDLDVVVDNRATDSATIQLSILVLDLS
jgi:hypothetical protein